MSADAGKFLVCKFTSAKLPLELQLEMALIGGPLPRCVTINILFASVGSMSNYCPRRGNQSTISLLKEPCSSFERIFPPLIEAIGKA